MPARKVAYSEEMDEYFKSMLSKCNECYDVAERARALGRDTETFVEIPQAEDLASRCEKLLADYHVGEIADDIRRLTDEYKNRELVCLMVAKEVAKRPADKTAAKIFLIFPDMTQSLKKQEQREVRSP